MWGTCGGLRALGKIGVLSLLSLAFIASPGVGHSTEPTATCTGVAPEQVTCSTGDHLRQGSMSLLVLQPAPGFEGWIEARADHAEGSWEVRCGFSNGELQGQCETSGLSPRQGATFTHVCRTYVMIPVLGLELEGLNQGEFGCSVGH